MALTLGLVRGLAVTEEGVVLPNTALQVKNQDSGSPIRLYTVDGNPTQNSEKGVFVTDGAGRYEFRALRGQSLVIRGLAADGTTLLFEQYDIQPGDYSDITSISAPPGTVSSVAGRIGDVVLVKADVGLGSVDNTSDASKPVSTATQAALDAKLPAAAVTPYTSTLLEAATSAAARTTLGLGTAAVASSDDFSAAGHDHAFAALTGKPTTVAGYGIADAATVAQVTGKMDKSTLTAKGSLVSASGAATPIELAVGAASQVLAVDASEPSGLGWKTLAKADVGLANVDNTTDLNKPVSTATQTALNAKASLNYSASAGFKTLVIGASTFSRSYVTYTAGSNYARASNVVTTQFSIGSQGVIPIVGQKVRVVSTSTPGVDVTSTIASVAFVSGTTYSITLPDARANLASAANIMVQMTGMATNTHCWPLMLNALCGGTLDYVNLSVGGTYTDEWIDVDRIAAATAAGPYDLGILNFGYGNAINSHVDAASYVVDKIFEALDAYASLCRWCVLVSNFGTTDVGLTPTSQIFTLNSRVDAYLKREVSRRYPNVVFVDLQSHAVNLATVGTSTQAMIDGRPPTGLLDSSGIHYTPYANELLARLVAREVQKMIPELTPYPQTSADNVFVNTVLDYDSQPNPNGIKCWDANTASIPATLPGLGTLGTLPTGTTLFEDGATGAMTALFSFEDSPFGGKRLVFTFNDPVGVPTGLTLGIYHAGAVGSDLTTLLNNTAFQNKDLDLWVDCGWSGFNTGALRSVYVQLVAKIGGVDVVLAAPISDYGTNAMSNTANTWDRGFSGILRTPSAFRIPSGVTYTNAQIQLVFRTVADTPLGNLKVTWGRMQLTARQPLI